jgi:hypothetical protein
MRHLIVYLAALAHADDTEDSYVFIDPNVRARVLAETTTEGVLRASGAYGKCASNVAMPANGGIVCDPPNILPQICSLVCKGGYYSSGRHKDVACADAMCTGPTCTPTHRNYTSNVLRYDTRECEYVKWNECTTTQSGLCLETTTETCQYSYYEEVEYTECVLVPTDAPDCWNSGCRGTCTNPGTYHYYTKSCPTTCAPWQDPPVPEFACSPCRIPSLPEHTIMLSAFVESSEIKVGCADGYWGGNRTSYCVMDGSFYPPIELACNQCSEPPMIEYETFTAIRTTGMVEFRCADGYVGDSTFTKCDRYTGEWNLPHAPNCDIYVEPSVSASPSPTVTIGYTLTSSPTPSMIESSSPSKTPRPPKIKGSRAPSPPRKWF